MFKVLQAPRKSDRYKPRISRTKYKPTVNVFASALKDREAFEQLKKNSRSHVIKVNIDNSLTCSDVPKALLTKTAAKEYSKKYGNIAKITIRPNKHTITVIYTSKMEANAAYYGSGDYMGKEFQIEWTKLDPSVKISTKKKNLHKNLVANLIKATDDQVKSESEAMANLEYNLHSDKETDISDTNTLLALKIKAAGKTVLPHEKTLSKSVKAAVKVEKVITESQVSFSSFSLTTIKIFNPFLTALPKFHFSRYCKIAF